MPPGGWTALFFLDEATALAAGHRPCALCRRDDWRAFARAWAAGQGLETSPSAPRLDRALHAQRLRAGRQKRVHSAAIDGMPDGAMIRDAEGRPVLLLGHRELPWTFKGYGPARPRRRRLIVEALTPPGTLAALAAGYRPLLHPSADAR
jgi:hypothetical protein